MKHHFPKPLIASSRSILYASLAMPLVGAMVAGCLTSPATNPAASTPPPTPVVIPAPQSVVARFHSTVEPILEERCYACHSGTANHTGVAFDSLKSEDSIAANPDLWLKVLRNTRSHVMPPPDQDQPTPQERRTLETWIEYSAFAVDPNHPDPGRQAIRRLNRIEYRNTIKDLLAVDFDVETEFPADDIGYGFDNIGDILNVSPMFMEKCVQAAQVIVAQGVPLVPRSMAVVSIPGNHFADAAQSASADGTPGDPNYSPVVTAPGSVEFPFLEDTTVTHTYNIVTEGDYQIVISQSIRSDFNFTPDRCILQISADEEELFNSVYAWKGGEIPNLELNVHWPAGPHRLTITATPTEPSAPPRPPPPPFTPPPTPSPLPPSSTPSAAAAPAGNAARGNRGNRGNRPPPPPPAPSVLRISRVQLRGPAAESQWIATPGYDRIFPRPQPPENAAERRAYARQVLGKFAGRAFRRPAPPETVDRLADIAQLVYESPGKSFEQGVAQAIIAVLASPRFLFRVEVPEPAAPGQPFINVDEYSLASRLSYFLWSTMPDEELFTLAAKNQLRKNFPAQVKRMLADPKSHALVTNFTGQWLESREIDGIAINVKEVQAREGVEAPNNAQIPGPARAAMKEEPEAYFQYILQNDRSVNEFLNSDYTFLNQPLAEFYKIPNITGPKMRKVTLPPGDLRGGALTMGSTLVITSNPTRTSPVKRGKWVLENMLGAPTPPPPPNIPPLELSEKQLADEKKPTLRQVLAIHRDNPLCASCHNRMDPIGLAMENFNAEGIYRAMELGQPIDPAGQLFTGETFKDVRELKQSLVQNHLQEFYRCLTEKMMIYATGRGMEYYDMPTVDTIVEQLNRENGRFSALLFGVVNSAPFQQQRVPKTPVASEAK